jgi:hypothetical protein
MRAAQLIHLFLLLSGTALAAVPVGTVALYSDGKVEKLLSAGEEGLRWEDDRKRQYLRSRNPAVPVLERRDFLSGRGYRQVVSGGNPDALRALPPGTPVEFSVIRSRFGGERSKRSWECSHLGRVRQDVLGTERELDRYSCERFVIHRKFHNRSFRERRDFTYSPELAVVVELDRKTRKTSGSRRLVALFPPGKADYKTVSRAVRKIRGD